MFSAGSIAYFNIRLGVVGEDFNDATQYGKKIPRFSARLVVNIPAILVKWKV